MIPDLIIAAKIAATLAALVSWFFAECGSMYAHSFPIWVLNILLGIVIVGIWC